MSKSDPTKDPEFQKVVRHFLSTPHTPHTKTKRQPRKQKTTKTRNSKTKG